MPRRYALSLSLSLSLCFGPWACNTESQPTGEKPRVEEPDTPPAPTTESRPPADAERPGSKEKANGEQAVETKTPEGADTPGSKGECDQEALAKLAGELEAAKPRDAVNLMVEGLLASCTDQLPPTVAHYLGEHGKSWDEMGLAPFKDERFTALKQKTCPGHTALKEKLQGKTISDYGAIAYDVCNYERFDLLTREQARDLGGMGWFTWSTHQLLLDQGTPADVAKAISRTMMVFEMVSFAPQLIIPIDGQELPSVDNSRPIRTGTAIYVSMKQVELNEMRIASLEKGFFPRTELRDKAPFAEERLVTGIYDELASERETSGSTKLLIAADRRVGFGAVIDTMFSASQAGFTEFELIVDSPFPIKRSLPVKYSKPYSDFDGLTVEVGPDAFVIVHPGSSKRETIKKTGDRHDLSWSNYNAKGLLRSVEKWRKANPSNKPIRIRSADGMEVDLAVQTYSLLMGKDCEDEASCPLPPVTLEKL